MERFANWLFKLLGIKRRFEFTKRYKLILFAFIATVFLGICQTVPVNLRYFSVAVLVGVVIILTLIALWQELEGVKFLILPILPAYFVAGFALFYFLLPVRWLTRLPTLAAFGISIYLLFLTQNVYNIAAIRTIQLVRAAHAVGFLFTILSAFFLYNIVFALHLPFYFIFGIILVLTYPLLLAAIWAFGLEEYLSRRTLLYSLVISLAVSKIGLILSFWPVLPIIRALSSVAALYVGLGITHFHFAGRLTRRTVLEYSSVAGVVFILMLVTAKWAG